MISQEEAKKGRNGNGNGLVDYRILLNARVTICSHTAAHAIELGI